MVGRERLEAAVVPKFGFEVDPGLGAQADPVYEDERRLDESDLPGENDGAPRGLFDANGQFDGALRRVVRSGDVEPIGLDRRTNRARQ